MNIVQNAHKFYTYLMIKNHQYAHARGGCYIKKFYVVYNEILKISYFQYIIYKHYRT